MPRNLIKFSCWSYERLQNPKAMRRKVSMCELISQPGTIPQNIILKILPSNFLKDQTFCRSIHQDRPLIRPHLTKSLSRGIAALISPRYKVTKKCENRLMNMRDDDGGEMEMHETI